MTDQIESQIGRVTGRIAPDTIGEVRLPYKGGSETFYAYSWEAGEAIEVGTEIVVVEQIGPRSVKVSPFTY
jgi:hypothetical protein